MLNETMQKAICDQINAELYSAYLYYAMSAYCQSVDLVGMASWFKVQVQEELLHASKFFDYVHDRGGRVTLGEIKAPPAKWESALAAFSAALEHEGYVTRRINDLVDLARTEKDQATFNFLQWFVSEQVEEEATASQIVGQLKLVGQSGGGLYMLDRELGTRVFTPPPAQGAA